MQKSTTLLLILMISLSTQAKDLFYTAFLISDSLKENASAVIRNEHFEVEIISQTKVRVKQIKAITVLNSKGKKKAWEAFSYDENKKITDLSARMYNATGQEVDKWNKSKWEDVSYDPFGTAYSDTRMLICKPVSNSYPYTIEYTVSYERNNTYMIDGWHPLWEDNLSIEKSTFVLRNTSDLKIKFKEYNFNKHIAKQSTPLISTWELTNMPAYKSEPYRPSKKEYLPYISVDANDFSYSGYTGKSDTWKDFGMFIAQLNNDRHHLPKERLMEVDGLLDTCTTAASKVKTLYQYMQSHTRYVNISIGIGGIQTFPAQTVSENGYGDCKALSNYMYALLKHAGIKSYFTLVNAGAQNYSFDVDYVGHQFNHAILCVPLQKDTIWLECTSQTIPCGFLGNFTDNRQVLLITEQGGVLAKTPKYGKTENKLYRNAEVEVMASGDCTAQLVSSYTGLEYDAKHRLTAVDKEQQLKMLYKDFDIPNFTINSFNLNNTQTSQPKLFEEINLTLPKYASSSGTRLFLPLNLASKWDYVPRKVKNRSFDIHVHSEFLNTDTICYTLPDSYIIEVLPEDVSLESKYGIYKSEIKLNGNKLIYARRIEFNSGIYTSDEYSDFVDFFKMIQKNDNALTVLKRAE
ncbi:protein of unknown function [Saccharicrinis carchari]|uniref:DUF3857 domain-containing protein n=1 Tax=Saccharicrinis carchari TaxID=1168039 RepID=A0A521AJM2_SACCC|nr:DUF3857 domain-containing protein [Saccharicrinis carchari]SMO34968.1 protein of unknown function [Saccharicrinis carchari]